MPKINQEEYEVLKGLDDKWKWVARDSDTSLWVYETKPGRFAHSFGLGAPETGCRFIYGDQFHFARWEDEDPYNIAELIEEYENTIVITEFVDGKWRNRIKESEETEVKKDIEWLKKRFDEVVEFRKQLNPSTSWGLGSNAVLKCIKEDFKNLINQLDEPEVLSQEWIDEHKEPIFDLGEDFETDFIKVENVQNLLVPKQEKVEVPRFVADILEENTFADLPTAFEELFSANAGYYYGEDVCKWIVSNEEVFARAWLDGYEIEPEPQYRLKAGENYLYFNLDGTVRGSTKKNAVITKERLEKLPFDVEMAVLSGIIEVEELEE